MTIPWNLLGMALGPIGRQRFWLLKWTGRTADPTGLAVDSYAEPIECSGSIQDVQQDTYEKIGLNYEQNVRNVWTEEKVRALDGQNGPDLLVFEGRVWTVYKTTPWNEYNGWNQVVAVQAPQHQQHFAQGLV